MKRLVLLLLCACSTTKSVQQSTETKQNWHEDKATKTASANTIDAKKTIRRVKHTVTKEPTGRVTETTEDTTTVADTTSMTTQTDTISESATGNSQAKSASKVITRAGWWASLPWYKRLGIVLLTVGIVGGLIAWRFRKSL